MSRKSKADRRRQHAEALRATIRQRTGIFCGSLMGLLGLSRALSRTPEAAVPIAVLACASLAVFAWLRRGWMREYREALTAAGIDPERDEMVEQAAGLKNTLLILFGVFGGMFVFIAVFIWLARG